jgi:predicted metal-binding protein
LRIRKIKKSVPRVQIRRDLEKYVRLAKKLGATDAKILETDEISLDYRATYKCAVPKCYLYNASANCPPHAPSFERTVELMKCFRFAILVSTKGPASMVVAKSKEKEKASYLDPEIIAGRRKMNDIVCAVESRAFYDGYYFATAFAGGNCKALFCADTHCQALEPGKPCRFPLRARPTMEAVGIDVYRTVTHAGLDIYPVGSQCRAEDVPFGRKAGLVLIC